MARAPPPHTETGSFQILPRTQFQHFTFETSPLLYTASRLTPLVPPGLMEMSALLLGGSLQIGSTVLLGAPPETHPKMRLTAESGLRPHYCWAVLLFFKFFFLGRWME